jgi:hypothetical protein
MVLDGVGEGQGSLGKIIFLVSLGPGSIYILVE